MPERNDESQAPPDGNASADAGKPQKSRPLYRRPWFVLSIVVLAIVLAIAATAFWRYERQFESTDDAFIDGHVVRIAAKVAGYAAALHVTDNELVHKGDVLIEVDSRDFDLALMRAKAAETSATARLHDAEAQVVTAQAQAEAAEGELKAAAATAENAHRQRERNEKLAPRAVSQEQLDNSIAQDKSAAAEELASRAKSAAADAQVNQARLQLATAGAALKDAQVQVAQARLNLEYTMIRAPITGRVTHRRVEQGDYLQVGQPLFALVAPQVWVTANFKETQLTSMRVGQPVRVRIDAFPHQQFAAHIDSFQRGSGAQFSVLPPENATGNYVKVVQRVPVKIVFDEPLPEDVIVGPGMSVVPRVTVR